MSRPITTEIKHFVPVPAQFRQARNLLGWPLSVASERSGVLVADIERLESDPRHTEGAIAYESSLKAAGISFAAYCGPSGQIYKTRVRDGRWYNFTRRGPMREVSHVG